MIPRKRADLGEAIQTGRVEDEEEEERCPVCKSDKFINPKLELLVSPCYHRVCSLCVERLFSHGSAPCPVCGVTLRRSNLNRAQFEDLRVEKECRIRKRLAAIFNKREEDFETLRDYNDYLEEVETIVFRLVEDVDVQSTNERLEAYRQANLEQINRSRALMEAETEAWNRQRQQEQEDRMAYEMQILAELEAEQRAKQNRERQFIEELARSAEPAATLNARRMVGREAKRKAQEAIVDQMPSMKGLKSSRSVAKQSEGPSIDPFETVPPIVLSVEPLSSLGFESWLFGTRAPDALELAAGGLVFGQIATHLLLAAFTNY